MLTNDSFKNASVISNSSYIQGINLLQLKRNSVIRQNQYEGIVSRRIPDFFLFDYYDSLYYLQKAQTIEEYLGIDYSDPSPSSNEVASQYHALIDIGGQQPHGNLFSNAELNETLPYISIVSITILPSTTFKDTEQLVDSKSELANGQANSRIETEKFLKACVVELNDVVADKTKALALTEKELVHKTYLCLNSGNFCIVFRSKYPEIPYKLTMYLRTQHLNKTQRYGFPTVVCSTYTITGIRFCQDSNDVAKFNDGIAKNQCKTNVVLRLSTEDLSLVKDLSSLGTVSVGNPKGLFGRYDLTLTLNMVQFGELYPWLCARKFGTQYPSFPEQSSDKCTLLQILKAALYDEKVNCINERLLLDIDDVSFNEGEGCRQTKDINTQNRIIAKELCILRDKWKELPFCSSEYRECVNLLIDLWNNYQNLRGDDDSFINGNMLLAQTMMLIKTTRQYLESMTSKLLNVREDSYRVLLEKFREAVDSINHFQKMMQTINRQTLQAPTYEVQMHTDLEKFIIAFMEFSRRYLNKGLHYSGSGDFNRQPHQQIMPIIMVDIREEAIKATPLFLLPYAFKQENHFAYTNPNKEDIILSIILPDIDMISSPYEMLPSLCHELSHNFRVKKRKERNDALLNYIFDKTARRVVSNLLASGENYAAYATFGRVEEDLLRKPLEKALRDEFLGVCSNINAYQNANIGVLLTNIAVFLSSNLFIETDEKFASDSPFRNVGFLIEASKKIVKISAEYLTRNKTFVKCPDVTFALLSEIESELSPLRDGKVPSVPLHTREKIVLLIEQSLFILTSSLYIEMDRLADALEKENKTVELRKKRDAINTWLVDFRRMNANLNQWLAESRLVLADQVVVDRFISGLDDLALELKNNRICAVEVSTDKKMNAYLEDVRYAILDACRTLKSFTHLANIIYRTSDALDIKPSKNQDELLERYYENAHASLNTVIKKYGSEYMADSTQEDLVALGIDLENSKVFKNAVSRTLKGMTAIEINALVQDSTTLYREVFADLGMCMTFNLSVFGYLSVLARSDAFMAKCREVENNVQLERIILVANVLDQTDQLDNLKHECRTYLNNYNKCIQESEDDDEGRRQMMVICKAMTEFVRDDTTYDKRPDLSNYVHNAIGWQQWIDINTVWNTLYLAQYLIIDGKKFCNIELKKHFKEMAQMEMLECWDGIRQSFAEDRLFGEIERYYNNGVLAGESLPMEYTKYVVEFVLNCYYSNWVTFGCRFSPCGNTYLDMEKSLERLIGGDLDE